MNSQDIEDLYELSPLQQGMLFHSLEHPRSGVYVEQYSCVLDGELDTACFERAWQEVVDRHTALRTSFHWQEIEKPLQVVHRRVEVRLQQMDWSHLAPAAREEALEAFLRSDREHGFDLATAPLLRLALVREGERTHRLLWSFHHLLLDGWSLPVVLGEAFALYAALRGREAVSLTPPLPYGAYIEWLQRQDLGEAEAFWRLSLADFGAPTPLPARRNARRGQEEEWYGEREGRLSAAATAGLTALARRHRLTLNTLLHGAWALLLSRLSGEEDVVFGSVVSGRPAELAGADEMVGLFINTLPVRVRVAPQRPWIGWLEELQARQVAARQYEHSPLPQVQRWSAVPRGIPLFESLLVFENFPVDSSRSTAGGLEQHDVRFAERTNYPLVIEAGPTRELYLLIGYDARRFASAAIERLLGQLRTVLEGMVAGPEGRLGDLPVLPEAERWQLLGDWNDTAAELPSGASFAALFAAQAARIPEAVAAAEGERCITYRELDEQAQRLAARLGACGVGPEVAVGLLGERGLDLLAAILAVFKAGAAYLPLDPHHPPARWAQALAKTRSPLVMVVAEHRTALADALPPGGPRLLPLAPAETGAPPPAPPAWPQDGRHLAYVLFTSGSTGVPKGALLEQRGMLNHLWAKVRCLGLGPGDAVAQTAAQSFDISVWQFLAALLVGGRVEIFADEVAFGGSRLLPEAARRGVTVLEVVPSLLRAVLASGGPVPLPGLRWLLPTGEALPPDVGRAWLQCYPEIPLVNAYGPTECSDDVAHFILREPPTEREISVPIGRPLPNLRLYVLDRELRPAPLGTSGELHVGGVGVGRGYVGLPAETAHAFGPDPFSSQPGSRLYRTGDLARHRDDGGLEYLGRMDQQVKIRGFRIEPGEVEAALAAHPDLAAAAVIAREDAAGGWVLVAYVVPRPGHGGGERELRRFLRERLPEPMVPAVFVELDALPLTPNGKVDRRALPEPDRARTEQAFIAPRTPVEAVLARIWSEVLRVERVGVHDDFFALGGDSILSLWIVARAQEMGLKVSVRQIFEHGTIAELAAQEGVPPVLPKAGGSAPAPGDIPLALLDDQGLDDLARLIESADAEQGMARR